MKNIQIMIGYIFMMALMMPMMAVADVVTKKNVAHSTQDDSPRALNHIGQTYFVYYDEQNNLLMSDQNAKKIHVIAKKDDGEKKSYNGAFSMEGNMYFIWRPKLTSASSDGGRAGDKHLMFRASYDGGKTISKPVRLDSGMGAFHPQPLVSDGDKHLYLAWLDERDGGASYGVFLNYSEDQGKSWLKHDIRMTGKGVQALDPFIVVDGKQVWLGWTEVNQKTHNMILKMRISTDGGKNWSREKIIPSPKGQITGPRLVKINEALLLGYYMHGSGILISRSMDNGKTWGTPAVLPGTKQKGSNGFKFASDAKENVCLAWSGPASLGKTMKSDIYASCSHDAGQSWDLLRRLDTNTPHFTHSLVSDIAMDTHGNVAVAWQDSRHIRPHIYINYSLDAGKNWLERDISIHSKGRSFAVNPSLSSLGGGEFALVWENKKTDSRVGEHVLSYTHVKLGKCLQLRAGESGEICPQQQLSEKDLASRKKRLKERELEFWNHYVNRDFGKAFRMFDPFVRQSISEQSFIDKIGKFIYLKAELTDEEAMITENHGKVGITVTVEAPDVGVALGKKLALERQEKTFDEAWIWIDGDWFKVYELSNGSFLPL
ncbi:MAG: sialidase family protein [Mariprofundaceae bacterium]